jgi:hypothetical protein
LTFSEPGPWTPHEKIEALLFTRIAIVAQAGPELEAIRQQFRNPMRYTMKEFLNSGDLSGLGDFKFDVLLMRLNQFGSSNVPMLMRARARFPEASLVTISPKIDPATRFQVRDIIKHKLILEPTETADLVNVVDKLARGDVSSLRMHPRTKREDEAEVTDSKTGQKFKAKFLDFAQMGARLKIAAKKPLQPNARVQLSYQSTTDPNKVHRIESQVIWQYVANGIVDTVFGNSEIVVGVRFIAAL